MDKRFYNISERKKKAEYVLVQGTGTSSYDLALYNIAYINLQLLKGQHYLQYLLGKVEPETIVEINWSNIKYYHFMDLTDQLTRIYLSKIVENRRDTWNYCQLLQIVKKYPWNNLEKLEQAINDFANDLEGVIDSRNTQIAHTSKVEDINKLHVKILGFMEYISRSVKLLDLFVDGSIPYELDISEVETINLRKLINE